MTTVMQWTGREARILRQTRPMLVGAVAAHLCVAAISLTDREHAELIRLPDKEQPIRDTAARTHPRRGSVALSGKKDRVRRQWPVTRRCTEQAWK